MRPVRLSLSGLNSFKEEQTIDFAAVCDGSVFGIFGPTGSGKSTVIDAITLALYGKVERAPRGLQGIVNKALDSALVDFTFALGTADGEKVYRVERKYVSKDESVTCRLARLTCLSGDTTEVLADKVTQVDAFVQSILGLTVEDFTRAVVLPQGKFAEFLSLRGTDRRDMLERIFGLSDYGEKLVAVVQSELRGTDTRLRELEIMIQSLGDADSASVKAVAEALDRIRAEVAAKQTALLEAETARDGARKIIDLQSELDKIERRRAELDNEVPRVEQLAQALKQLELALGMEQLVEDTDAANTLLAEAVKRQTKAESAEADAALILEQAELAFRGAEESLQSNEPALQRKLADGDRADRLESALARVGEELRQETAAVEQALGRYQTLRESSESLTRVEQELSAALDHLRKELDVLRVDPRVRVVLGRAEAAGQRLTQTERQLQEVSRQRDAKVMTLTLAEETLASAKGSLEAVTQQSVGLNSNKSEILASAGLPEDASLNSALIGFRLAVQQLDTASRNTAELEKQLSDNQAALQGAAEKLEKLREEESSSNELLDSLTATLSDGESRVAELRRRVMAETLARDLLPEVPCPVCGAMDHPSPAEGDDLNILDDAENDLRELRGEHGRVFSHITSLRERRATAKSDSFRLGEERDKLSSRLQGEHEAISRARRSLPMPEVMDGSVEALIDQLELVATRLIETRQDVGQRASDFARLKDELAQIEARYGVTFAEAEEERATVAELMEALGATDITDFARDIARRDRKVDEVSLAIRPKEQEVEKTRAELGLAVQSLADTKVRLRELEASAGGLKKHHLEYRDELDALTSGIAAADFLRNTTLELTRLRETLDKTKQALRSSRDNHALCRHDLAVGTEAVLARGADAKRLNARLDVGLTGHGFADIATWRDTVKYRHRQDDWQREVAKHRAELLECSNEIGRLSRELAGRKISTEAWQSLVALVNDCAAGYEAAVEGRGRAEAALADVRRRYEELVVIRAEEKPLRIRKGLLDEIAALLRGNALVEFMATEHLYNIAGVATGWLRHLSRNRYALEVAPDGGFLVRDDAEGGTLRPVFTLSGGETFVTALALALALSSQIQLRGRYPLEFFFLDEGFGTLDPELLDVVMGSLERMQGQNVSIGIISHVPELRERIQRKITVVPAESGGQGSRLVLS